MERREFKSICKDLLQELNITQSEFAKKINTTQATVSRWCSGVQEPSFYQLQSIAIAFDVDLEFLIGLTK